MGRTWLTLDDAIGAPFGSCFEARGARLARVAHDVDGDAQISTCEVTFDVTCRHTAE